LALSVAGGLMGAVLHHRAVAQEAGKRGSVPVVAVLELFTSQGCSSCPTADAILMEFASRPGVIALTLPVDYWDYLGWRDTLASSANSERQRALARSRGDGMIFTPQMVVNGVSYINGNRRDDIEAALRRVSSDALRLALTIVPSGERLTIAVGNAVEAAAVAPGRPPGEGAILVGAVQTRAEVKVRGGENGGRKLAYTNVVHAFSRVGTWKNAALSVDVDRSSVMHKDADACVAMVQENGTGRILAATMAAKC
jgi:hypothetical protein